VYGRGLGHVQGCVAKLIECRREPGKKEKKGAGKETEHYRRKDEEISLRISQPKQKEKGKGRKKERKGSAVPAIVGLGASWGLGLRTQPGQQKKKRACPASLPKKRSGKTLFEPQETKEASNRSPEKLVAQRCNARA